MKLIRQFCLSALLLAALSGPAHAADAPPASASPSGQEMNGIRLHDYAGFQDRWKLVTVRYRTDTTEMRFTYANDLAYAALLAGGKNYPNGAVFGKIGLMTADDPAFTSSKVPSGAKRIQLMVYDKSKYADTGGWGYAVFDPRKDAEMAALPQDSPLRAQQKAEITAACFACHQLVQDRDYVFSVPADLTAAENFMTTVRPAAASPLQQALTFAAAPVAELPAAVREHLTPDVKTVRLLQGALRDHVSIGTLGEIRPSLIEEAAKNNAPALFLSSDRQKFNLVAPDHKTALPDGKACPDRQKAFSTYSSMVFENMPQHFCH